MSGLSRTHDDFEFSGKVYLEQGKTYQGIFKYRLAVESHEKALKMMEKTKLNLDSIPVDDILFWLGRAQFCCKDYTSALVTHQRSLEIKLKLFSENYEKRISSYYVSSNYLLLGILYHELGKDDESKKCFANALKISSTERDKLSNAVQCFISSSGHFNDLDVDFGRNISVVKSDFPEWFHLLSVVVAHKTLRSGQYESGIALLRDALEVELNVLLEKDYECFYVMLLSYLSICESLVSMGKLELAQKVADRALQLSESQVKFRQPCWIFHSDFWKGWIYNIHKKSVAAIKSLECAIKNVTGLHGPTYGEIFECQARCLLAEAYTNEGRYEDALNLLSKVDGTKNASGRKPA